MVHTVSIQSNMSTRIERREQKDHIPNVQLSNKIVIHNPCSPSSIYTHSQFLTATLPTPKFNSSISLPGVDAPVLPPDASDA
jgi:hypothetical protein